MKIHMRRLLLMFVLLGCQAPTEPEVLYTLTLDSRLSTDSNGYNYLVYSGEKYFIIGYKTQPFTRVYWFSPDSFSIVYQDKEFISPIVDYSTYSDDEGNGNQGIFLSDYFIGDTIRIYGYINEFVSDSLRVIIQ